MGINDNTINLANFYPILCGYDNGFYECVYYGSGDPFFSECADYVVTLTAPQQYALAGGGEKQHCQTANGKTTTKFTLKNARSFAMVLSSKFQTVCGVVGDTKITYYYYDDATPQTSLETAIKSLKLFNDKFGQYPYSTYSVVQTAFVQGGMEFPTITFISDNLDERAYQEVIVHETAHQWWQTVVGNNEVEHGFLDEGLAEYSVVLFYENYPEYSLTRKMLIKSAEQTYRVYCSVVDRLEGKVNTSMLRSLKEYSTEYEYVNIAYVKGCIMFDYLRQTIGDQKFFNGLKRYYKDYSFKIAKPDDLVGVYEKTGANANGFFESFYQGKVVI
jgi:aminopeptidase N